MIDMSNILFVIIETFRVCIRIAALGALLLMIVRMSAAAFAGT